MLAHLHLWGKLEEAEPSGAEAGLQLPSSPHQAAAASMVMYLVGQRASPQPCPPLLHLSLQAAGMDATEPVNCGGWLESECREKECINR